MSMTDIFLKQRVRKLLFCMAHFNDEKRENISGDVFFCAKGIDVLSGQTQLSCLQKKKGETLAQNRLRMLRLNNK